MTALAFANLGDGPDSQKVALLDRLVHHGASIIGLCEAGDRGKMLRRWCETTGWQLWDGDGSPGAESTPILWNPAEVKAQRTFTRRATPATYTGRLGAGPSRVKAKVWNGVRFAGTEDREPFVHINGHLPASLYLPKRRALAKRQASELEAMVRRRQGRFGVVVTMDANSVPGDRLWNGLRKLGMTQRTKAPTHGRRLIDHVWTLGIEGHAEVIDVPSDHRAVLFSLR